MNIEKEVLDTNKLYELMRERAWTSLPIYIRDKATKKITPVTIEMCYLNPAGVGGSMLMIEVD